MFWKRKKKKPAADRCYDGPEKRQHPRFYLPPELPAWVVLDGNEHPVRDVSEGGIAFAGPRSRRIGEAFDSELRLGRARSPVSAAMTLVDIDFDGICHARFIRLSESDRSALRQFIEAARKRSRETTGERRMITDDDL